jgi:mgtE-like transporter
VWRRRGPFRRLRRLFRDERRTLAEGVGALLISSGGDLLAGLTLGSLTHTLDRLPGLLVLVPAAIGMRGNVFGALGSRLGTLVHTGQYRLSRRLDSPVGQNMAASFGLSVVLSAALAVAAKAVMVAMGLHGTISVADLLVVSVVGGVLSSLVVLSLTVAVASASVRRGWDLDNVASPIVTAAGDIVTLPALFLATVLVRVPLVTPIVATACAALGVVALMSLLRSNLETLHRIAVESIPVLFLAGVVDIVAGVTIENRLATFATFPALLVMVPPFLEDSGSLGGILSARLGSKLNLGLLDPRAIRWNDIADDVLLTYVFALVVFVMVGVSSNVVAAVAHLASPGVVTMMEVALLAGVAATTGAILVAVGTALVSYRVGLDPDNYGIPMVTSSLDLLGAGALITALAALGVR